MRANILAKWFLNKNPNLCNGLNDENKKLNKLLYFSNLMYHAVYKKDLIEDKFEKWDNGPVIRSIYTDYRYNDLDKSQELPVINDEDAERILYIVNYVYGAKTATELSEESHNHSIWINPNRNENIDFYAMDKKEISLMCNLFDLYKNVDFENIKMEKINGNIYYYDKRNLVMTDEIISYLSQISGDNDPAFIENIDGEIVFS